MYISPAGLLALRSWVIVVFVVAWNIGLGVAMWLNGGAGQIKDPRALAMAMAVCTATSALAWGVLFSSGLRRALTDPNRRERYDPAPFFLIAVVTVLLAGGSLFALLGQ